MFIYCVHQVSHYKLSLSWPRILPDGMVASGINSQGVTYYTDLIDQLLANEIQPLVTLYHWDLPQALQSKGGWSNPASATWFRDYADFCFGRFGAKVGLELKQSDVITFVGHNHVAPKAN